MVECGICGGGATDLLDAKQVGYVEGTTYSIYGCQYCETQFVHPALFDASVYNTIYQNAAILPGYERYYRYAEAVRSASNPLLWLSENEKAFEFVRSFVLSKISPHNAILEVGCGLGYLTYALRASGYDAMGCDLSADAIQKANKRFGNYYHVADATEPSSLSGKKYDLIILTELIEHLSDPIKLIEGLKLRLTDKGTILLTTPNKSFFHPGAIWQTENPPVHLWWFSETSIRRIAELSGMNVRLHDFSIDRPARQSMPSFISSAGTVMPNVADLISKWNKKSRRVRLHEFVKRLSPKLAEKIKPAVKPEKNTFRVWQIGAILTSPPDVL